MNKAGMSCGGGKATPASAMVSDICSSIKYPWVEISSGATQVCLRIGIAERIAITTMVIAKNFAILASPSGSCRAFHGCAKMAAGPEPADDPPPQYGFALEV